MHLSSFFDLRSRFDRQHSYFSDIPPGAIDRLNQFFGDRIMSIDYIIVNPSIHRQGYRLRWLNLIAVLAVRVMDTPGYDGVLGTPRTDVGGNRMADRIGFVTLQDGIQKDDYTCSFMACPRGGSAIHPDTATWMTFCGPLSFFGYILCLEGLAVDFGPRAYDHALRAHEEKKAVNFIKVHCAEDVDHLEQAFKLVEAASLGDLTVIERKLQQCIGLSGAILDSCLPQRQTASILRPFAI